MLYIIEKKKTNNTDYTKDHLYLSRVGNTIHIVVDIKDASKFKKGSLSKLYAKYGRENLILHKIEGKEII